MRPLFNVVLLSLVGSVAPALAGGIEVFRVWPGYRTAESFERISDFFGGGKNDGGEIVRRSQPSARQGYYFLVRLKNPGPAVAAARFELQVISPSSPDPRTYTFTADVPAGSHAFDFGLTGRDWPEAKASAVAWRLVVSAPDGAELARRQSFLWAKPDAGPAAK
jgi:hypothetical protein